MPLKLPLALLLFFLTITAFAQPRAVTVNREIKEKQDEREAVYIAANDTYARYTIMMNLNGGRYERADAPIPVIQTISPGNNRILTLSGVNGAPGYSFTYVKGCLNTKPKDVTYLLPLAEGKRPRIDTLSNLEAELFNRAAPKHWTSYTLSAAPGDTVFASRRGTVVSMVNQEGHTYKNGVSFSTFRAYLEIEHEDCTRARYDLIDNDHLLVESGQRVEAGTPIGVVAEGKRYVNGTHLRFSVFFPVITREIIKQASSTPGFRYANEYVAPTFPEVGKPVPGDTLTIVHPEAVILQEMTKREIKRYRKKRGQ